MALAAIYRTIKLLNELNLIDRVGFDDGFVGYETGVLLTGNRDTVINI